MEVVFLFTYFPQIKTETSKKERWASFVHVLNWQLCKVKER